MTWTLHLRDNYEFEMTGQSGGLVSDDEMWELNKYGYAKHFKIKGRKKIRITWIKNFQFDHFRQDALIRMVINRGGTNLFPQCK